MQRNRRLIWEPFLWQISSRLSRPEVISPKSPNNRTTRRQSPNNHPLPPDDNSPEKRRDGKKMPRLSCPRLLRQAAPSLARIPKPRGPRGWPGIAGDDGAPGVANSGGTAGAFGERASGKQSGTARTRVAVTKDRETGTPGVAGVEEEGRKGGVSERAG